MEGFITINSDASYFQSKQEGGFGIWIKSDAFTIKVSGKFKGKILDANEAELKALINGFHLLENKNLYDKTVVINCDNMTVRNIVNHRRIPKRFISEGTMLIELCKKYKTVYAKRIKGHRSDYNSRQYVNNWCDRASRQHLKTKP